eukprot:4153720-Alexandrium_andersonii.AAC.1
MALCQREDRLSLRRRPTGANGTTRHLGHPSDLPVQVGEHNSGSRKLAEAARVPRARAPITSCWGRDLGPPRSPL